MFTIFTNVLKFLTLTTYLLEHLVFKIYKSLLIIIAQQQWPYPSYPLYKPQIYKRDISQTSYTALCNGVVSHWAQIVGIQVFTEYTCTQKQTQNKFIHDLRAPYGVSTRVHLHAQTIVDGGDIRIWRAVAFLITGETWIPQIWVPCWDQNGQGRSQPHSPRWARVPLSSLFPQISIKFSYFSSNFYSFLPHFGPLGGGVAHPGRPWLRHWKWLRFRDLHCISVVQTDAMNIITCAFIDPLWILNFIVSPCIVSRSPCILHRNMFT